LEKKGQAKKMKRGKTPQSKKRRKKIRLLEQRFHSAKKRKDNTGAKGKSKNLGKTQRKKNMRK